MNIQQGRKASITITFDSPAAALAWHNQAITAGLVPDDTDLFQRDGLDELVGSSGVPTTNAFILRGENDRAHGRVEFADRIRDVVVVR